MPVQQHAADINSSAQTPAPDNAAKPAVSGLSASFSFRYDAELKAGQKSEDPGHGRQLRRPSVRRCSGLISTRQNWRYVRSASATSLGRPLANTNAVPFLNQNGKMFVLLSLPEGNVSTTTGTLAFVEVEALADGKVDMTLEKDALNLLGADGKNFAIKL